MRDRLRKNDQLRKIELIPGINKYAEGSCLSKFGDTQVLCLATLQDKVPPFLRNSGKGWVTAEYAMLPRSTDVRNDRDYTKIHPNGRTMEISRLIGRALRSAVDLGSFGERQVIVDCDVLQADGGTRTAAITGGFVAMYQAFSKLVASGKAERNPARAFMAAVSVGIIGGEAMLDLDFTEDNNAQTDANFVITGEGGLVEIQATAEKRPFSDEEFSAMLLLAKKGTAELVDFQKRALKIGE